MLISLYLEDKTAVVITDQGLANADVYYPGSGITKHDADTLQKWITGKLSSLPVYESEKNQGAKYGFTIW